MKLTYACVIAIVLVGCGDDDRTTTSSDGQQQQPSHVPAAPTVSASSASTTTPPATTTTPPPPAPPPDPNGGLCQPNASCGGMRNCTDTCYSSRCCLVSCSCNADPSDPAAHLQCTVSC